MQKALIEGATNNPGAPEGMEGAVGTLPVRVVQDGDTLMCQSAWKPSLEEIGVLLNGGYVLLTVVGWQVPVSLSVVDSRGAQEL